MHPAAGVIPAADAVLRTAAHVTSRAAGRHRRRLTSQISPSSLLFAYPDGPGGARSRDRRAFTLALSASLVGVAAAALVGSLAPLNSTWAADRGSGAAGSAAVAGLPQVDVPWSASPLSSLTGQAVLRQPPGAAVPRQPPGAGQVPTSTRPLYDLTSGKGGRHRTARTAGGGNRGHHRGRRAGQPGIAAAATGTGASARAARSGPRVVVSYLIDREWAGGFQGQVRVVNNGARPITGWQAVIALPRDRVTWFWNASGFVSHHIMLLRPLSAVEVVPAGGGTLSIFFTATGRETTPQACAFDGIPCG